MMVFRLLMPVVCFCCLLVNLKANTYFQAEQLAIDFKMPTLVEDNLQSFVLEEFPKGCECRKLLAQCCYLRQDFESMKHHIGLSEKTNSNLYLNALYLWYSEKKVLLVPLLLAKQNHCLGEVLSAYNSIIFEPINSIQWAHFWTKQNREFTPNDYKDLYHFCLEMKAALDPSYDLDNSANWQQTASVLFLKGSFIELKTFLQKQLVDLGNMQEKLNCLLWLLKTKVKLNENVSEDIINFLTNKDIALEDLDIIFSEWMKKNPDVKQRLDGLKSFYKIYKKKNFYFHCQYLQLLQANCLLDLGRLMEAKKLLDKNIVKIDQRLQSFGYELLARHTLLQSPINYRLVADYLIEAKKRTGNTLNFLFYSKIQAECYCLIGDYDRAYYTYQEVLPRAEGYDIGHQLSYEWILCGILCNETMEELQAQFDFCQPFKFLSEEQKQALLLKFVVYQMEQNNIEFAYDFLNRHFFTKGKYREQAKLLLGKCYYKSNAYAQAHKVFNQIIIRELDFENYAEFLLWKSLTLKALGQLNEANSLVQKIFDINKHLSIDLLAQANLLQAKILAEQHSWPLAKQCLLDFYPRLNEKWQPLFLFHAGLYAEQNGLVGQEQAIDLFQKLYDQFPTHVLAIDARIKQGTLFMNLNQPAIAQQIFENILPALKNEQALWCKYLIQKCNLLAEKYTKAFIGGQLELLLRETMTLSLRLEIVLQLALLYKDEDNVNSLQKLLWQECSGLLENEENITFSVNEAYWLSRCLLLLAQNTKDQNVVRQIYTLMIEAQLPSASLLRQYLENE